MRPPGQTKNRIFGRSDLLIILQKRIMRQLVDSIATSAFSLLSALKFACCFALDVRAPCGYGHGCAVQGAYGDFAPEHQSTRRCKAAEARISQFPAKKVAIRACSNVSREKPSSPAAATRVYSRKQSFF